MNKKLEEFSIEMSTKGYKESHCRVLYSLLEQVFGLQVSYGCSKYDFADEDDISIVNPFYESSGRFEVNPITEYGNIFLSSDHIKLLDEIKSELGDNPNKEDMNLCIAKHVGEIQTCVMNQFSTLTKKAVDICIEECIQECIRDSEKYSCPIEMLCYIIVDNKKIINPFEDGKLIEEYKDLYLKSKFANLLID